MPGMGCWKKLEKSILVCISIASVALRTMVTHIPAIVSNLAPLHRTTLLGGIRERHHSPTEVQFLCRCKFSQLAKIDKKMYLKNLTYVEIYLLTSFGFSQKALEIC